MTNRAYYSASINDFLGHLPERIIGSLAERHSQDLVAQQTAAWRQQIAILKDQVNGIQNAHVFFEFLIPRMGKRADVVLVYRGVIFVIEFKVGEKHYRSHDLRQAQGYALDLNCFHEGSRNRYIVPILLASEARDYVDNECVVMDFVFNTIKCNKDNLSEVIPRCLNSIVCQEEINISAWLYSSYKPTPTIIEAAQALYANHEVEDIVRNDAGAKNLSDTMGRLNEIIGYSRINKRKSICFVTGVPGAGKTLVGLKIATDHNNPKDDDYAVFLSGNGPLVDVLREALARDKVLRDESVSKTKARRETSSFIQNVHHFRDDSLNNIDKAPVEKVVIFDEAQRAWDKEAASGFMRKKRGVTDFDQSEPEFLVSVMDRHEDWCVIIALIGGGQEINNGEAGLTGWFEALKIRFSNWNVYYSENLTQAEYAGGGIDFDLLEGLSAEACQSLHLSTSMRSFRADRLSNWVHYVIHNQLEKAAEAIGNIRGQYPIKITRDFQKAKAWVRSHARGLESCGLIASSGAKRLKPEGIFVSENVASVDWFLNDKDDVRSSNFLENVATEFLVQGLELDWCLVAWDADYRYQAGGFEHWKFSGTKWQRRHKPEQRRYLENTYRVLLTRARQGMVIYVPIGDKNDSTRPTRFYNDTYNFLVSCGAEEI